MFTNVKNHGGEIGNMLKPKFRNAQAIQVASGYVSYDVLSQYQPHFNRVASSGNRARLLLGMAFYEGLNKKCLDLARNLSQNLQQYQNGSGVFVSFYRKYHGKVFSFDYGQSIEYLVGSANFSRSGLAGNIECTVPVTDTNTKQNLSQFLDFLFDANNAVSILKANIISRGSPQYLNTVSTSFLQNLQTYNPATINQVQHPLLEVPLDSPAKTPRSNFNVYFGKGRKDSNTGFVRPRPWYEVEIIARAKVRSSPLYPIGDFTAYTDDGYIIPMKTSSLSSQYKNIRSRDGLQVFGEWIKGKLQRSGALQPLTPVTPGTLNIYGKDKLILYKINQTDYYMEF